MIRRALLIFFFAGSLLAQSGADCENNIQELLASGGFDGNKIQRFLNLQASITLHKLGYAAVRHTRDPGQFKLEKEILGLLDQMKSEREADPEFNEVYEMFNHPDNKVSRNALARVAPYIFDILNEQSGEESSFKRKFFNLGLADVKMLAILAEKEKQNQAGVFQHAQFTDRAYDQSVLNFTKIINSSVASQSDVSKEHMLASMEQKLAELQKSAKALLEDMNLPAQCLVLLTSCAAEQDGKAALDDDFLNLIAATLSEGGVDKHEELRYGDAWLYNNSKIQGTRSGNIRNVRRNPRTETPPVTVENENSRERAYEAPEKSDEEVVKDYLVQHVLNHVPQLFEREELLNNMDFTTGLAQAIDQGILLKKGRERVFLVGEREYFLPELWNTSYGSSRASTELRRRWARLDRGLAGLLPGGSPGKIEIPVPPDIPERYREDFITTFNDQFQDHGHVFAFAFRGKLYHIGEANRGRPLAKGIQAFKNGFLNRGRQRLAGASVQNSPLESANLALAAGEIRKENRSYIKANRAFHISGAPVELGLELARAKQAREATDARVAPSLDRTPFPERSTVNNLIAQNRSYLPLVLKTFADRKRAFDAGDGVVDVYRGVRMGRPAALTVVVQDRRRHQAAMGPRDTPFIEQNALAILNGEATFSHQGKNFSTHSGLELNQRRPSSTPSGFVNYARVHDRLVSLNSLPDKDLVIQHYKQNGLGSCEFFTMVDKETARVEVFKIENGRPKISFSSPILIGKETGDERTLFRSLDARTTNDKTGAGSYTFGRVEGSSTSPSLRLNREVPGGREEIPLQVEEFPGTSFPPNRRATNGFIQLPPGKIREFKNYTQEGCPFHVLPETDELRYRSEEGKLRLTRAQGAESSDDFHLTPPARAEAKEIKIVVEDEAFANPIAQRFVETLESRKAPIMEALGLTNDEYNELAKLAFGVLGTETSFGEGENFKGIRRLNVYRIKESRLGQRLVGLIGRRDNPRIQNSRGLTQIKDVQSYLEHVNRFGERERIFPEITPENLTEPENAAAATMFVLAEKLRMFEQVKHLHPGITEENKMDYLYYMYIGSDEQITTGAATPNLNAKVREANGYADQITVLSKED